MDNKPNVEPGDDVSEPVNMQELSVLFSAEYTDLPNWAHDAKQYSEDIPLQDKKFYFYCQPDETKDTLKIFVRCDQRVITEAIIVTAQSPMGETVIFRSINAEINGAIGTRITMPGCEWSKLKNMSSPLTINGKLIFIIHVILKPNV